MAESLEGTVRSIGIHAAGVVISQIPLDEVVPIQLRDPKDPNNTWLVSQYEQAHIEELGTHQIRLPGPLQPDNPDELPEVHQETRGIDLDLEHLPDDDARTYELLRPG